MSEPERWEREPEKDEDPTGAYAATAVGVALIAAAVLIIITLGIPAAGIVFIIGAGACLGWGIPQLAKHRRALPASPNKERELLSAIRDNGGSITPTEAAMETSLTVREADGMLSELAGAGHLAVESHNGALFYSLPGRKSPELER